MSDPTEVHYSNWAQQPDVRFACGISTTPAWLQRDDLPSLVYEAEGGWLYTFERTDLVTCPECLEELLR